jgi:hypothetical protein
MTAGFFKKLLHWVAIAWAIAIHVAAALLSFAGGAVAAAALVGQYSQAMPLLSLVFFFVFLAFCVLVHELGHAVGARLMGWRIHLIVVGWIAFRVKPRKFTIARRQSDPRRSGWVLATPGPNMDWNRGWPAILIAGPLSNVALAGATIIAAWLFGGRHQQEAGFCNGIALVSLTMGLSNLIPMRGRKGDWNDGGKLLDIIRGRRVSETTQILTKFIGLRYDGIHPGSWDPALVHQLEAVTPQDHDGASRDLFLLNYYLAQGDIARAHATLERSEFAKREKSPDIAITRAFLIGLVERDAEKAGQILDTVPQISYENSFQYWRAMAVVLGLRGQASDAREAVDRARAAATTSGASPDQDDMLLFSAIENGDPVPSSFSRPVAA